MKIIKIENKEKELKKFIGKYTNYKNFSRDKERAYLYTKEIGINVCPYCNINYTYTVYTHSKQTIIRPDIDHFESQSGDKENKKTLDIYNLVPSCQQCNSRLKRDKDFTELSHIHPYKEDFDSVIRIAIDIVNVDIMNEDNFNIDFIQHDNKNHKLNNKAKNNINDFKLLERYQYHKKDVIDIFHKIKFYHQHRTNEIDRLIDIKNPHLGNILFSDENCDINSTSLGKLKRDIIKQYSGKK